ncbi:MAG: hypothetical protein HFE51_00685 [Clostridia bacterium]|jgi:hypothetical protein|nr:hypothetical protein [Clostridia bacterium]MCI8979369.1 hypothetical protein [Clostridia bacterium]MCI9084918.1 hypothetical protein [Clostridia bacterium]NDO18617.1 hypothetical protein [Lachnospiraceae bacterium MD329]
MKKEEILEKSRAEKKDEGVEFALEKGRLYGITGMTLLYLALLVFNRIYEQNNSSLFAMYWTYLAFEMFGRYRVRKNKNSLAVGIVSILMAAGFLVSHIIMVVR